MSLVTTEKHGAVTLITINRPEKRNAINKATADALREAFMAFDADVNSAVAVLTGTGGNFCAGADLTDVQNLAGDTESEHGPLGMTRLFLSKPTIAAVSGYAVAGGIELACWCDLRIADESAVFGCFERRFGVPLIDGGTQRLPRIVGLGRALEMILTGRAVHADEALRWGLANEVVPQGESVTRAIALGEQIAQFPQTCLRNDRHAVYAGMGAELLTGLKREAQLGMATILSGETASGVGRFMSGEGRSGAGIANTD